MNQLLSESPVPATVIVVWAPFYAACAANGIPKTTAWKMLTAGVFDVVRIGNRPYVRVSNFMDLNERVLRLEGGAK